MSKQRKKIIFYILLPVGYVVLSMVLLLCFRPFLRKLEDSVYAMMKQGAPEEGISGITDLEEGTKAKERLPVSGEAYARLLCGRIDLNCSLSYGDSDACLREGAGQYANDAFPWNNGKILAGGHDATYFAPLADIVISDEIVIKTIAGKYLYQVVAIEIRNVEDLTEQWLNDLEYDLILYTCYPFGADSKDREERFLVYCIQKEAPQEGWLLHEG